MGKIYDSEGYLCGCSSDSCRVDCPNDSDGFCCIDHSITNRLLSVLGSSPSSNSGSASPLISWIEFRAIRTAQSFTPSCVPRYSIVIIPLADKDEPFTQKFESRGSGDCGENYGEYFFYSDRDGRLLGTAGWLAAGGGSTSIKSRCANRGYPPTIYYSPTAV